MGKKIFNTIDLFAGIGGIRLGFEDTRSFKTLYANDFDRNCKITYDLNFHEPKLEVSDIKVVKSIDLPDFDLLLAGFPCQAFSIAGYRQGFNDEKGRGNLFFEIERLLKDKEPMAFLLENVKNLQTHDNGNTFIRISEILRKLDYFVSPQVLNAMEFGNVPQNRERIYIVGFKNIEHFKNFKFPSKIPLTRTIKDILDEPEMIDSKYYYNGKSLYSRIVDDIKGEETVYQWRRQYVRENKNKVFPTLTANMGMGGHNVPIVRQGQIIRKITPRECARVQGFSDRFQLPTNLADAHLYKQLGNSVCVPVINRIAKNIYKALTI